MDSKNTIKQKLSLILVIVASAICLAWLVTSVINNAFAEEAQNNQEPQAEAQLPSETSSSTEQKPQAEDQLPGETSPSTDQEPQAEVQLPGETSPSTDQEYDGTTTITINFDSSLFSIYVLHRVNNPLKVETYNLDASHQIVISGYDHLEIETPISGVVTVQCYKNPSQDNLNADPDAYYQLSVVEKVLKNDFDCWEGLPESHQPFTEDKTFTLHTKEYTGTYSVSCAPYYLPDGSHLPDGTPVTYRSADGSYSKTNYVFNNSVTFEGLSREKALGFVEYSSNEAYTMMSQVVPEIYTFGTHKAWATAYYGEANRLIGGDEGVQNFNYALSLYYNPATEANKQAEWQYSFDSIATYDSLYDNKYLYVGTFAFRGNCQIEDNGNIKVYYRDGEESDFNSNVLYATLSFNTKERKGFDYWEVNGETYRAGDSFVVKSWQPVNATLHTKDLPPEPEPVPTPSEEVSAAQTGDRCEAVLPLAILAVLAAGTLIYSRKRAMHK